MKKNISITFFLFIASVVFAHVKTIHVYVALCDNEHQGIVPVPSKIGNGKDLTNNLYWGCGYGVKSFFKLKTTEWIFVKSIKPNNPFVLERVLFKHKTKNVYLLADAYDGEQIKSCIQDFLKSSNGQHPITVVNDSLSLRFGGGADLLAYVGHDGLMEFEADVAYEPVTGTKKEVMILACYSKEYFSSEIKKANALPVLWTTHLMAPEAYTLKSAIDGWLLNESGAQIEERAAQTYHQYQNCGLKGARNLFTTGF